MVHSIEEAVGLVQTICALPGNQRFIADTNRQVRNAGIIDAVQARDTPALYRWLIDGFSYQGISDAIAWGYIDRYGNATWKVVEAALENHRCSCPKLASFETYQGCRYQKAAATCGNPAALTGCPVPALPLRKGALNETAYSLYFFIRDECDGDLVGYIDRILEGVEDDQVQLAAKREALIAAFSRVRGVSSKLINMMLAMLLMAGDPNRRSWVRVGQTMVAVDSLVHNFFHRTGILAAYKAEHPYGQRCFGQSGCTAVLYDLASQINAKEFNRTFPRAFPRFVQYAIWSFCAELRLNICNGRQIDDSRACQLVDCPVGDRCSRFPLRVKAVEGRG